MKKPFEMSFAEFADLAKPSGAVNRLSQPGIEEDVLSYSVYLNGPVIDALPESALDHLFQESRVLGLTEKLGLDNESFRDKLKVAELVATRSAWMTAVLEASTSRECVLPAVALADYEALSDGFDHPWIAAQIDGQRRLSENLPPALKAAEEVMGRSLADQIPEEITRGVIVSQSSDFTVQATKDGVVAHENRRLATVPGIGQDVTVLYYKGNGQVFENGQALVVSSPFVDERTGDLAVSLMDEKQKVQQIVLFNGLASLARFVEHQGLDKGMVERAIEAREAVPKRNAGKPPLDAKEVTAGRYIGPVVDVTSQFVVQKTAPDVLVAHKLNDFAQKPRVGDKLDVQYGRDGKASVVDKGVSQGKEVGR